MDMFKILNKIFSPIVNILKSVLFFIVAIFVIFVLLFFLVFIIRYRINLFNLKEDYLLKLKIKFKPYDFMRYVLIDLISKKTGIFKEFGFSFFVGRQGAGKTISMVAYLNRMKQAHPKCKVVTNFYYSQADYVMKDWKDFMEIRNGEDGVIFAIDEIHSEYSSDAWKNFPENLLSEISQQRKQCVKIVATAQVFSRVAKPLREQAFSVFVCQTFLNRFTKDVEYDANDYSMCVDKLYKLKEKIKPISKFSFVQTNLLRSCYDTFEKIERMKKLEFIPRGER